MTSRAILSVAFLALASHGLGAQQPAPPAAQPAQPYATTATPDLPRVTLPEALRLSARNAPAMVQARQGVRTARAQERQALGAYLPTLTTTANESYTPVRLDATTGTAAASGQSTPYNQRFGFTASVPLFTGFQRGANQRAARATSDQREAAQLQAEYATALATKQAFFAALANAELVTVAEAQLRRSDEQLKLATEKLRLGATTRSDSLTAMVDYGNSQLQAIQARANLQYAQVNLGRAIGMDGAVAPVPDTALETRLGTLDTAVLRREALSTAPSVRQAEASLVAARAALAANRAQYFPSITASYSQSWSRALNAALSPTPYWTQVRGAVPADSVYNSMPFTGSKTFAVAFSFPIFNGFGRETNIINADANVINAEANLRDARLFLDASLTQAIAGLNSAAQQIDIARSSVAAAEENLRMQRERYRLGTSTIVDLLTSQAALNQAQATLVQARYNYLVARAQIEALVGHSL